MIMIIFYLYFSFLIVNMGSKAWYMICICSTNYYWTAILNIGYDYFGMKIHSKIFTHLGGNHYAH